jgi:hypothetical protein
MNKKAKLLWLLVIGALLAGCGGCAHRPAYSEMDANRASRNQNQNQNNEGQASASTTPAPPAPAEPAPAPVAAQPATGTPPGQAVKKPSFMDQATGGIKDLPAYPGAYRVNVQIGPMQGVNMISLALKSTDPMDKITAFYERVIKENKWTVVDKLIDPEFSEWTLKKGEDNSAKVQVKKDQQRTTEMNIVMVRVEKLEGPSK